jgi:hypothetical protein
MLASVAHAPSAMAERRQAQSPAKKTWRDDLSDGRVESNRTEHAPSAMAERRQAQSPAKKTWRDDLSDGRVESNRTHRSVSRASM